MKTSELIRSMTDEQLAGYMADMVLNYFAGMAHGALKDQKTWENTKAGFLQILEQEVPPAPENTDDDGN